MAERRKFQTLVDGTIKRVEEGVTEVIDLFTKVDEAQNPGQKSRLQEDLKKEIKKLQRHREDIMKWIEGPDARNKTELSDWRRKIEEQMERYKSYERECKTKPFSALGLQMSDRLDPAAEKRREKREAMEAVVERLRIQGDEFKVESEQLSNKRKKSKEDQKRADQLRDFLKWHDFHMDNLDQLQRRLDNEAISVEDADEILAAIADYEEHFQDADFQFNDSVYEEYSLENRTVNTPSAPAVDLTAGKIVAGSSGTGSTTLPTGTTSVSVAGTTSAGVGAVLAAALPRHAPAPNAPPAIEFPPAPLHAPSSGTDGDKGAASASNSMESSVSDRQPVPPAYPPKYLGPGRQVVTPQSARLSKAPASQVSGAVAHGLMLNLPPPPMALAPAPPGTTSMGTRPTAPLATPQRRPDVADPWTLSIKLAGGTSFGEPSTKKGELRTSLSDTLRTRNADSWSLCVDAISALLSSVKDLPDLFSSIGSDADYALVTPAGRVV